jgi:hypothetical protein
MAALAWGRRGRLVAQFEREEAWAVRGGSAVAGLAAALLPREYGRRPADGRAMNMSTPPPPPSDDDRDSASTAARLASDAVRLAVGPVSPSAAPAERRERRASGAAGEPAGRAALAVVDVAIASP